LLFLPDQFNFAEPIVYLSAVTQTFFVDFFCINTQKLFFDSKLNDLRLVEVHPFEGRYKLFYDSLAIAVSRPTYPLDANFYFANFDFVVLLY